MALEPRHTHPARIDRGTFAAVALVLIVALFLFVVGVFLWVGPAHADSTAGGGGVLTEPGVVTRTLSADTGNEVGLKVDYTVNKATSGNDTGLELRQTDTSSPGVSYFINGLVNGSSKFYVSNLGSGVFNSLVRAEYVTTTRTATATAPAYDHTGTHTSWGSVYKNSATVGAMNGDDTLNVFHEAGPNSDHTGYNNALRAFRAGTITGDAQAVETALSVGTGWDYILDSDVATLETSGHEGTDAAVAPALTSCGTNPSIVAGSSDRAGIVTIGSGVTTACTLTFATAYAFTPACVVSPQYNAGGAWVSAKSATAFTVTFANDGAGQKFDYRCTEVGSASYFVAVGDSRTTINASPFNTWQDELATALRAAGAGYRYSSMIAAGGWGVDEWSTAIDASLAAHPLSAGSVKWVFLNLGINDVGHAPSEVDFKTDYAYILDAIHVRWPYARVLCSKFWAVSLDASVGTYNGYVADVVADGRTGWAAVGDDESVWAKGADAGATMTSDGVHYSVAGETEKAAQVKTAMGY